MYLGWQLFYRNKIHLALATIFFVHEFSIYFSSTNFDPFMNWKNVQGQFIVALKKIHILNFVNFWQAKCMILNLTHIESFTNIWRHRNVKVVNSKKGNESFQVLHFYQWEKYVFFSDKSNVCYFSNFWRTSCQEISCRALWDLQHLCWH